MVQSKLDKFIQTGWHPIIDGNLFTIAWHPWEIGDKQGCWKMVKILTLSLKKYMLWLLCLCSKVKFDRHPGIPGCRVCWLQQSTMKLWRSKNGIPQWTFTQPQNNQTSVLLNQEWTLPWTATWTPARHVFSKLFDNLSEDACHWKPVLPVSSRFWRTKWLRFGVVCEL